ncbi:helix-turn-helix domain-containing protein [Cohnella caldifontis]|uniref:helix-turn-helix domain-containing protein n=1 Tax=Cohnella caldifontis TaxID=3027471 RepID=UPI0023ED4C32|nr:helix-turn-helix domain-containing protein [Cohnella sp. YIM B05605]
MYRLLVVDDEDIITDGVTDILSALEIPDLDLCKAYSGSEALDWLTRTRIDIVLTDIRMPEIDGLELMDLIRRNWPRCRIIFLTGYNDFDPVYKAIQTAGVRFLLKSEGYPKIVQAVKDTIRELDEDLRIDDLMEQVRSQRNTLEALAHGDYFRHALFGAGRGAVSTRSEDFRKLKIPLDPLQPVLLVLGSLIGIPSIPSYADRQEAALAVKLLGDHYLRDMTKSVGIIDRFGDPMWLIQPDAGISEDYRTGESLARFLEGTLELIQAACLETLGMETAFTICDVPFEWDSLPQAYEWIRQLQHDRVGDGASMVMTVSAEQAVSSVPGGDRPTAEKFELLAGHLEGGREDAFMGLLKELSEPVYGRRMTNVIQVMELFYSVALVILSYVNRRQLHGEIPAAGLMRFDSFASWQEGFDYLARTAETLFALRRRSESHRAAGAVERICAFIEGHLGEDLSLVRLAGRFHFNPSYLSRLFKQECGTNLSEYIDEARIRKAKELLARADLKIHEIGERVGYEAPHSFTRFFKKTTGVSPQAYRDAARNTI